MKKSQATNQMLIYILSIIIIGMLLILGVKWIIEIHNEMERVKLIEFTKSIEDAFERSLKFGDVNYLDIDFPGKIEKICFVERGKYSSSVPLCSPGDDYEPLMCNGWKDNVSSIYFKPVIDFEVDIGEIEINSTNGYLCFEKENNGNIAIKLTGHGDKVLLQ